MSTDQKARRDAFGPLRGMPNRDEVRSRPDAVNPASDPGAVPWAQFDGAAPDARVVPESCVNFTLPGGGAVLMSVPTILSVADARFAVSVLEAFLTSLADRMKP